MTKKKKNSEDQNVTDSLGGAYCTTKKQYYSYKEK